MLELVLEKSRGIDAKKQGHRRKKAGASTRKVMAINANVVKLLDNLMKNLTNTQGVYGRTKVWISIMDTLITHQEVFRYVKMRMAIARKVEEFKIFTDEHGDEAKRLQNTLMGILTAYDAAGEDDAAAAGQYAAASAGE